MDEEIMKAAGTETETADASPAASGDAAEKEKTAPARTGRRTAARGPAGERQEQTETGAPSPAERNAAGTVRTRSSVLAGMNRTRAERETAIAEAQTKASNESILESMRRSGAFAQVRISAIEELDLDGKRCAAAAAFTETKQKVVIPFDEVYNSPVMDMSTVDLSTEGGRQEYIGRQKAMLSKLLGLTVSVNIRRIETDFDGLGHDLVIASRREANSRLRNYAFIEKRVKLGENEVYEATIISVTSHSLAATFWGVDFVKQQNDLTECYLLDLQTRYRPGDRLRFVLEKLSVKDGAVTFYPNTREAELREAVSRQYLLSVNSIVEGIITRVYKAGDRINIYAWLPAYGMPVKIPYMNAKDFGAEIKAGVGVCLTVTGFRPSGYLEGRIRSVAGPWIFQDF